MRSHRGPAGEDRLRPRPRLRDEQPGEARRVQLLGRVQGAPDTGLRRPVLLRGEGAGELSHEAGQPGARGGADADPAEHRPGPRRGEAEAPLVPRPGRAEGGHDEPVRVPQPAPLGGPRPPSGDALPRLAVGRGPLVHGGKTAALSWILPRRGHGTVSQPHNRRLHPELPVGLLPGHTPRQGVLRTRPSDVRHGPRSDRPGGESLRHGDERRRHAGAAGDEGGRVAEQDDRGGLRGGPRQHDRGRSPPVLGRREEDRRRGGLRGVREQPGGGRGVGEVRHESDPAQHRLVLPAGAGDVRPAVPSVVPLVSDEQVPGDAPRGHEGEGIAVGGGRGRVSFGTAQVRPSGFG
mmetsp:Transcript_20828/g.48911  ORF Transcript_20828/g.48911 Transcript_20828/m.48911 type:complete len:349 (+) Transcript_20828:582-1628(+)